MEPGKKKQKRDKFCIICADSIKQEKDKLYTTYVDLTKEQVDFLKNISKSCECSEGRELCKTVVMRVLISVLMLERLGIMEKIIKSKGQLKEKLIEAFCKYK